MTNKFLVFLLINYVGGTQYQKVRTGLLRIQDLTWSFNNETHYWKGNDPFSFTKSTAGITEGGYWYAANNLCAGEHGGTHCDAPYHVCEDKWKIGDIPIERLVARAAVIDLSEDVQKNGSQTTLQPYHLRNWVVKNGPVPENTILIVRFNWSQYWSNRTAYFGSAMDEGGHLMYPGFSVEAAEWIVNNGKIVGVATDTPDVDPGHSTDYMAQRTLCTRNIYMCEQVKLLNKLPAKDFTVLVMLMKIELGTAAPARIVAIPPK